MMQDTVSEAARARQAAERDERDTRGERDQLQNEIQRLKTTIVNKEAQVASLEDYLKLEKERRAAETEKLSSLLL